VQKFEFSASGNKENRANLYERMIQRLLPADQWAYERNGQNFTVERKAKPAPPTATKRKALFSEDELSKLDQTKILISPTNRLYKWKTKSGNEYLMTIAPTLATDTNDGNVVDIQFAQKIKGQIKFEVTKAGDAAEVFNHVAKAVQSYVAEMPNLKQMRFTASGLSRTSLYEHMLKRLLPSDQWQYSYQGGTFTLTKKNPVTARTAVFNLDEPEHQVKGNRDRRYTWKVGENTYKLEAFTVAPHAWAVSFGMQTPHGTSYINTKTGNAVTVLNAVAVFIKKLIENEDAESIEFTTYDTGRRSVYLKMIQRLLPNWVVTEKKYPELANYTDIKVQSPE